MLWNKSGKAISTKRLSPDQKQLLSHIRSQTCGHAEQVTSALAAHRHCDEAQNLSPAAASCVGGLTPTFKVSRCKKIPKWLTQHLLQGTKSKQHRSNDMVSNHKPKGKPWLLSGECRAARGLADTGS